MSTHSFIATQFLCVIENGGATVLKVDSYVKVKPLFFFRCISCESSTLWKCNAKKLDHRFEQISITNQQHKARFNSTKQTRHGVCYHVIIFYCTDALNKLGRFLKKLLFLPLSFEVYMFSIVDNLTRCNYKCYLSKLCDY